MKTLISVKDASGNILHETYEKRAKGLVKKGRAYYVDAHTICLLSQTEENSHMEQVTLQDIFTRIDNVLNDKEHIKEAMMLMERIPNDLDEDVVEVRCKAIRSIVSEREETNRSVIHLLETMYNHSKEQ